MPPKNVGEWKIELQHAEKHSMCTYMPRIQIEHLGNGTLWDSQTERYGEAHFYRELIEVQFNILTDGYHTLYHRDGIPASFHPLLSRYMYQAGIPSGTRTCMVLLLIAANRNEAMTPCDIAR